MISFSFFFFFSLLPISSVSAAANHFNADDDDRGDDSDETSSLLSMPGDIPDNDDDDDDDAAAASVKTNRSRCIDVTGLALLYKVQFWQVWLLMGLLTGVGLMTIKWVPRSRSVETVR